MVKHASADQSQMKECHENEMPKHLIKRGRLTLIVQVVLFSPKGALYLARKRLGKKMAELNDVT